jgi:hypothetical protein
MAITVLNGVEAIARTIVRGPWVVAQVLGHTPDAWLPMSAAIAMLTAAWWCDRTNGATIGTRDVEVFACAAGAVVLTWFVRAGRCPWNTGDWREEWTFFVAWTDALQHGSLPYYLRTAMQGTERYFANLQTPMVPYAFALASLPVGAFLVGHLLIVYVAGFVGAVKLRRELALRPFPWTVFVVVWLTNGHIVTHLSAGHLPWIGYFLMPWVLLTAVRIVRGEHTPSTVIAGATALTGMILIGSWHVFVWSLLFIALASALSWPRLATFIAIGAATAGLSAVRLAPGVVTFGTGSNVFVGGFPTLSVMFTSLVGEVSPTRTLDAWELDTYVGVLGFALLCLGLAPFRDVRRRSLTALLLPAAALAVLSFGTVYANTLFRLPGFVSERVATRFLVVAALWLTIAGLLHVDDWWDRARNARASAAAVLLAAWFLTAQCVLHAQVWRPPAGAATNLPTDVVKLMPVERVYWWAFWSGVVVSGVTAAAIGVALRRDLARR